MLSQARARSTEAQRSLSDTRQQLAHADDLIVALKREADRVSAQHDRAIRDAQSEAHEVRERSAEQVAALRAACDQQVDDLQSQLDNTRAELEEAHAQQRIIDAKRSQLVKELRKQLKQELVLNREMQVTIRSMQDELGEVQRGTGASPAHLNVSTQSQLPPQQQSHAHIGTRHLSIISSSRVESASFSASAQLLTSDALLDAAATTAAQSPPPPAQARRHTAYSSAQFLNPQSGGASASQSPQAPPPLPVPSGVGDEVAAAMMQKLADAQEQNFTLRQKIKALELQSKQKDHEAEGKQQIIAALINRFGGSANTSGRLTIDLASLGDEERRNLYRKMDRLLEELSLHNIQLKATIDALGAEVQRADARAKELESELEQARSNVLPSQLVVERAEASDEVIEHAVAAACEAMAALLQDKEAALESAGAQLADVRILLARGDERASQLADEVARTRNRIATLEFELETASAANRMPSPVCACAAARAAASAISATAAATQPPVAAVGDAPLDAITTCDRRVSPLPSPASASTDAAPNFVDSDVVHPLADETSSSFLVSSPAVAAIAADAQPELASPSTVAAPTAAASSGGGKKKKGKR